MPIICRDDFLSGRDDMIIQRTVNGGIPAGYVR